MIFYDSMTGRTFKSNRDEIIDAVNELNRKFYEELRYRILGRHIGNKYDLLTSKEFLTKELLNGTFDYGSPELGVTIETGCMPQLDVEFNWDAINGDLVIVPKYSIKVFG